MYDVPLGKDGKPCRFTLWAQAITFGIVVVGGVIMCCMVLAMLFSAAWMTGGTDGVIAMFVGMCAIAIAVFIVARRFMAETADDNHNP